MANQQQDLEQFEKIIEQSINTLHAEASTDLQEKSKKSSSYKVPIIIFGFTLIALVWSMMAELEITVSTRGEVLLDSDIEKVQHLEGGILLDLYVAPGDIVYKGQKIALIQSKDKETDLNVNTFESASLSIEAIRYSALLNHIKPDFTAFSANSNLVKIHYDAWFEETKKNNSDDKLLKYDITHKKQLIGSMKKRRKSSIKQLKLIQKQLSIKNQLYKEEMASLVDVLGMQVQESNMAREIENLDESLLNEGFDLQKISMQLENSALNRKNEYWKKLTDIKKQLHIKTAQQASMTDKVDRLLVYSPVDGTVDKLNYNYISAVISPGDSIAEITPLREKLHGEIKIPRKDIGFIEKNQKVKLKFDAYNFAKYGVIHGVVSSISRGSYKEEDAEFYLAIITMETDYLDKKGVKYALSPYMEFTADIKTGSRRVIDYAAKPVMAALEESFNER